MTQHTSLFTRLARRTADVFAEMNYAQRRMFEVMAHPAGK